MNAFVDERKCPAQGNICPVLSDCPQTAVTYEPDESAPMGGRIVVDQDRCDGCGLCVTACCGHAMELRA
jgi:Pyruvate/2-oxoacid:ferredoxin oxidoreductase delta subunit